MVLGLEGARSPKVIPSQTQASWLATRRASTLALFVLVLAAAASCEARPQVILHTRGGAVRVQVELADTPETRARGLMYRKELPRNAGMLFVFPEEDKLEFWMKNTPLPLDMIFFDRNRRVVGIVERAQPFSTTPRGPGVPAQYVLEVNGGFAAEHGIQVGDRAEFQGIPRAAR